MYQQLTSLFCHDVDIKSDNWTCNSITDSALFLHTFATVFAQQQHHQPDIWAVINAMLVSGHQINDHSQWTKLVSLVLWQIILAGIVTHDNQSFEGINFQLYVFLCISVFGSIIIEFKMFECQHWVHVIKTLN